MTCDFDKIIERRGSGALKYDALGERYGNPDLMPLWVADMDFATPSFIVDALRKRIEHPLYGYTVIPKGFWPTVADWINRHHDWKVSTDWLTFIPGIVKGIGMAVNLFTEPGDKIIIQPPVYHPFRMVAEGNGRIIVQNPLLETADGSYVMDFEGLERIADEKCRLLILSNPHNPGGIVWDKATLTRLADFCHSRNILVISDEIHCDMTLWGNRHTPFASVSDKAAECSITFGAPSKTFNIAGIVSSYAVVPNEKLRNRFFNWLNVNEFDEPTLFAPIATMAAFSEEGERWRREMLAYIEQNIICVENYFKEKIPSIRPMRPSASFLVWLDCRGLKLTQSELVSLFVDKAGLALNDGSMFGKEGEGFMRLNVALPRAELLKALSALHRALQC